jgi:hypothetical protein
MHLKVETHHLVARIHTVKAGTFPVALYHEHEHGLYLERAFVEHPSYRYWKAHILGHVLRVRDLYLDLGIAFDKTLTLLDTHELFEALRAGLISLDEAMLATQTLHDLINRLGQHQNSLEGTLRAQGIELKWDWELSPTP